MNPMQLMNIMKNPQQNLPQLLKNNTNPVVKNILIMAQNNDMQGLEQFARNFGKEQGLDFDKDFQEFMSCFK